MQSVINSRMFLLLLAYFFLAVAKNSGQNRNFKGSLSNSKSKQGSYMTFIPYQHIKTTQHVGNREFLTDIFLNRRKFQSQSSLFNSPGDYDYDVGIIGGGVGGHAAAIHAAQRGLKVAVISNNDLGGTCVNRGCVPSKALLAASGKIHELKNPDHLKKFGIEASLKKVDRSTVARHASDLASTVQSHLISSLKSIGVEILQNKGFIVDEKTIQLLDPAIPEQKFSRNNGNRIKVKNIIIATGSVPFVPPGIEVDEETVFTSDGGLKLPGNPDWVGIVGSGYIGLEFSDVLSSLGADITFIESRSKLMPLLDNDIARVADRLLIKNRGFDSRVNVFAKKIKAGRIGVSPVVIELVDATTQTPLETIEVDACMIATGRSPVTKDIGVENLGVNLKSGSHFIPVDTSMRVLANGKSFQNIFCVGDANGELMLAHAASAQGIGAVEQICGNHNYHFDPLTVPAACFTHPEIAFVGMTEEQAKASSRNNNFQLGKSLSYFKANSKALSEGEGEGMAKILYRKENGHILGVHIIGKHASDLIHECSNAISLKTSVYDLARMVHTHPTLSEVVEDAYRQTLQY